MCIRPYTDFSKGEKGGVGIRIIIIVATLAIVATAIFLFLNSRQKDQEMYNRKATEISDYGLQQVFEQLKNRPSWTGNIPQTEYEDGWFTAKAKRKKSTDASILEVESVGRIGSVSRKQECVLRLTVNGRDSIWVRQNIK